MRVSLVSVMLAAAIAAPRLCAQDEVGTTLRTALGDGAADFWIYDDLDRGFDVAEKTGKPLLVSFRCVP